MGDTTFAHSSVQHKLKDDLALPLAPKLQGGRGLGLGGAGWRPCGSWARLRAPSHLLTGRRPPHRHTPKMPTEPSAGLGRQPPSGSKRGGKSCTSHPPGFSAILVKGITFPLPDRRLLSRDFRPTPTCLPPLPPPPFVRGGKERRRAAGVLPCSSAWRRWCGRPPGRGGVGRTRNGGGESPSRRVQRPGAQWVPRAGSAALPGRRALPAGCPLMSPRRARLTVGGASSPPPL